MSRAVSGHRLRLRSLPGHGRAGPCPRVGLGLAVRVRVAPAGCAPAAAEASSIRLPLRAVSGSPVTRLSFRSAQGWRQRAGGRSGASLGGGGRAGRVRRACLAVWRGWLWCGRCASARAARRMGGRRACACSDWVRLGGTGECVTRQSDCSVSVNLLGARIVSQARLARDSRCLAANYWRAGFLAAGAGAPSGPHFIVVSIVSTRRAGRVHSWYVVYP